MAHEITLEGDPKMRARRFAAATLAAALLAGATGCADEDEAASNPKKSAPAETAVGTRLTADDFGNQVAAAQMEAQSAHIEGITSLPVGQDLKISGDVQVGASLEEFKLAMVVELAGQGSIELRLVDGVVYVKLPATFAPADAKPWVMLDVSDPDNPITSVFNQLMSSLDPSKLAALFESVEELDNLGREDIKGVATTHYRVTIDTAKLVKVLDLGKLEGVDLESMLKEMPESVSSDVWVDDDALLVKTVSELSGSRSEMYYSNWGEPISVRTPPARDVGKLPF